MCPHTLVESVLVHGKNYLVNVNQANCPQWYGDYGVGVDPSPLGETQNKENQTYNPTKPWMECEPKRNQTITTREMMPQVCGKESKHVAW